MSKIRFKKTVFTAVVISAVCLNIDAYAQPEAFSLDNITVLGDSISTGYGLENDELSYCDYLEKYFNAELDNYAVNGRQTSELIKQLDEDKEVRKSLEKADLVCVSIGGNDILHVFEDALYQLDGISQTDNGQFQISSEFIQQFLTQFSSGFGPAASQAKENMYTISEQISNINSAALVVFQTVYNPFETDNEQLNNIMKPLKVFTSMYLGTINNSVKQQPVIVADINLKLNEKPWLFTNINELDIHPNYLGHMLIAEEIVQKLRMSGNYDVFKDAASTIPKSDLSQIPENIMSEVRNLSNGCLRIKNSPEAAAAETDISETQQTETSETAAKNNNSKKSTKSKISGILFKLGICLVMVSLCIKIYSNMRKDRKTK
ncbi:SGNH/GDSL hydrolase family protein [Porcipelethomonas sp.]|uniref:SGNH/GDSL hydrolase family protein n=1 Tax=Porcipelethomonas sp. TaxID=2981675 RepID=UPI003EFA3775